LKLPEPHEDVAFAEPWQAQVFAMAVRLSEAGHFTWREWSEALGREVAACEQPGYAQWLSALEGLLVAKGLMSEAERTARVAAWDRAARATPHGEPILLNRA
jgi:nitrile hydratase accessory protein